MNIAAIVTVPPSAPAQIRVASAPIASASGPTTAKDSGRPAIVIIQSRLVTRPSSCSGTNRCNTVNQMMISAAIDPSAIRLMIIACQSSVTTPKPAVANMPAAHVRYRSVIARCGRRPRWPNRSATVIAPIPPAA